MITLFARGVVVVFVVTQTLEDKGVILIVMVTNYGSIIDNVLASDIPVDWKDGG